MKESVYKSYEELPLFLNARIVAQVLGIAPSSAYELMHESNFPVLKVGSRMVVPKEKFIQWVERNTGGDSWCSGSTQNEMRSRTFSLCPTRFFLWVCPPARWRSTPTCSTVRTARPTSAIRAAVPSARPSTWASTPCGSILRS